MESNTRLGVTPHPTPPAGPLATLNGVNLPDLLAAAVPATTPGGPVDPWVQVLAAPVAVVIAASITGCVAVAVLWTNKRQHRELMNDSLMRLTATLNADAERQWEALAHDRAERWLGDARSTLATAVHVVEVHGRPIGDASYLQEDAPDKLVAEIHSHVLDALNALAEQKALLAIRFDKSAPCVEAITEAHGAAFTCLSLLAARHGSEFVRNTGEERLTVQRRRYADAKLKLTEAALAVAGAQDNPLVAERSRDAKPVDPASSAPAGDDAVE